VTGARHPRLYEWECAQVLGRTDQDVGFWIDVARRSPGPLLELACGTGRVTLPLAAAGIDVVGLDVDPDMLAVAASRRHGRSGPRLVAADMRHFALATRFVAVIVPYNSLQLLCDPVHLGACLDTVRAHLSSDGVFAAEVTDFQIGACEEEVPETVIASGTFDDAPLTLAGSLTHDLVGRTTTYRRRYRGPGWEMADAITVRSYDGAELAVVLEQHGFTVAWSERDGNRTRLLAELS